MGMGSSGFELNGGNLGGSVRITSKLVTLISPNNSGSRQGSFYKWVEIFQHFQLPKAPDKIPSPSRVFFLGVMVRGRHVACRLA